MKVMPSEETCKWWGVIEEGEKEDRAGEGAGKTWG